MYIEYTSTVDYVTNTGIINTENLVRLNMIRASDAEPNIVTYYIHLVSHSFEIDEKTFFKIKQVIRKEKGIA